MPDRIVTTDTDVFLRAYRREVLRTMRREGARVRVAVRGEMRRKTGNARRRLKLKVGWDSSGPYARIVTTARRVSRSDRTGRLTSFRYGLAQQQRENYLQRGLARTPRR